MAFALKSLGRDEALDFGSFGVWLFAFALWYDFAADDEFTDLNMNIIISFWIFMIDEIQEKVNDSRSKKGKTAYSDEITVENIKKTHIILLAQPEESSNLTRPLRAQPFRMHRIRQPRKLPVTLLNNTQSQHAQIHSNNASSHALSLSLAITPGTVARMAFTQQEADTSRVHDTLLHWKTLLVVASCDAKDVAGEFRPHAVPGDFGAHAAVHEDAELALIFDFD